MSTRVEDGTVLVLVTALATLSAGTAHLSLSAREGPARGTWRYNLATAPTAAPSTGASPGCPPTWTYSGTQPGSARRATSQERSKEACSTSSRTVTWPSNRRRW